MPWETVATVPFQIATAMAPARAHAIRDALLRRAVPLVRLVDGRCEPLATASLIEDGPLTAVLTAAHVLERANVGDLAIPLPREHRFVSLRSARVRVISHPSLDLAMLWFVDRAAGRQLAQNWVACPLRQWTGFYRDARVYAIAGYPTGNTRRDNGRIVVKPAVVFSGALEAGCFAYGHTASRVDGLEIFTPELDGMSGATVWAVDDDGADDVACLLRPSAVQVAFQHSRHFRGVPIHGAGELLDRLH